MVAQPLRVQDAHGIVLSHFSLSLLHSAQDMAPFARLISCSLDLAEASLSSICLDLGGGIPFDLTDTDSSTDLADDSANEVCELD